MRFPAEGLYTHPILGIEKDTGIHMQYSKKVGMNIPVHLFFSV